MKIHIREIKGQLLQRISYIVECQNTSGFYVGIAEVPTKKIADEVEDMIRKHPYILNGLGYLFDI
jgi:hypothetical protein